ncbi:MAG: MFS transporter, partial [Alphaproteobacteria bacterium]
MTSKTAPGIKTVVAASTAGTAFEWYDFFLYVPLVPILTKVFFSALDPTTGYIMALLSFFVGFAFRPVGALIFGRVGDRIGRKATFLVTMSLMGAATFAIGFIPNYATIGIASPLIFVAMRILQGLALGGEWGGAAIYIVEHVETNKRGAMSAWLGCSAAFGLAAALLVVLITRDFIVGKAFFNDQWGWRIPFMFSAVLLAISLWFRLRLHESPVFAKLRQEGRRSESPLTESFLHGPNLRRVLMALFAIMLAQGAVWYCVFFYAQTFMEKFIKVDPAISGWVILAATACSVPLYLLFGALSDKVGRKPVMLFGLVVMLIAYFPAFHMLEKFGNPALSAAQAASPVSVLADPADCSVQFDPVGKRQFVSSCDIAKSTLANAGVSYDSKPAPKGALAEVHIGATVVSMAHAEGADLKALTASKTAIAGRVTTALKAAGYPAKADPATTSSVGLFLTILVMVIGATALYGPQAAALVEMFPANVRYTALSLPYHIG